MDAVTYKRLTIIDGTISIDIPYNYNEICISEVSDAEAIKNVVLWNGPDGRLLSIQRLPDVKQSVDEEMNLFRYSASRLYGSVNNLGYYTRKTKGFQQVMAEDELIKEDAHSHCMIAILKNDEYNIVICQRTKMKNRESNKASFLRIVDSVSAIKRRTSCET